MKFLVDAHLPYALGRILKDRQQNVLYTNDMTLGNASDDESIIKLSMDEQRIVITKDTDFYHSFLLRQMPYKLLLIKTGNIKKADLVSLFEKNIDSILVAFENNSLLELTKTQLIIIK